MSNSTILRQLTMLKLIPTYPSNRLTKEIHQRLFDEGFKVSKRTVERDLDKLSSLVGVTSIKGGEGLKWSYMTTASDFSPAIVPSEALLICIAHRQILDILPFKCISNLESRFIKAEQTLANNKKFKNWQDKVKIVSFGLPLKAKPINDEIRLTVYEAMLNNEQLQMTYQKEDEKVDYTLNTHGLIIREHTHYLVATKNESPDDFQLFKLSRIVKVSKNHKNNQACSNNIKSYLNSNASGYLLSDKPIKLQLLATGSALAMFKEAMLSEDQTIEISNESKFSVGKVTATVDFTHELIHFLLGFGKWIRVKSPDVVIQAIKDRHRGSLLTD